LIGDPDVDRNAENDEKNTQRRGTYGFGVVVTLRGRGTGGFCFKGILRLRILRIYYGFSKTEGYSCPEREMGASTLYTIKVTTLLYP
jgi:hypothetical protein